MRFIKRYRITVLLWALAALCALTFNLIGSHIDNNGLLHEPFALIPLTWFFFFSGLIVLAVNFFKSPLRRLS